MKHTNRLLLALTAILIAMPICSNAWAGDKAGNGGDEVGLQFSQAFQSALDYVHKNDPALDADLAAHNLAEIFSQTRIMVVRDSLMVSIEGITQDSMALNDPSTMTVSINRARWNALIDVHLKEAIAIHEIAGLAGIESSGSYSFSSRYLKNFGLSTNLTRAIYYETTDFQKEDLRNKLRVAEGTYTATIQAIRGKSYPVEITIMLADHQTPSGLMPGLMAHYRRLDVIQGQGIGEYIMDVDLNLLNGNIVLQGIGRMYGSPAPISVRGTLLNHELKAEIRDFRGYVGTFQATATDVPPAL